MLIVLRDLISHQFEAALCTLDQCIGRRPDSAWNAPVGNLKFCQVAFHTLFYTDFYLGSTEESFRDQPYHREHAHVFRDYEELEPREQRLLYDKASIVDYLAFCRRKLARALAAETVETLMAPCGFPRRQGMTRAELYVYNLRHVQHHAAQLSLRLRLDFREEIPWIASGWRDIG
jgi:hypothetical protein